MIGAHHLILSGFLFLFCFVFLYVTWEYDLKQPLNVLNVALRYQGENFIANEATELRSEVDSAAEW